MNTRKIASLAVATVALVAIIVIVILRLNRPKPVAPAPVAVAAHPMVKVVVAKTDLKIGQRISPDDLTWQDWPADAVNPAFITDGAVPPVAQPAAAPAAKPGAASPPATGSSPSPVAPFVATISGSGAISQLNGAIVREPILAKEPIVELKIVRAGEGGMVGAVLPAGMRGVSVPITAETGAGGLIQPGDRVDLIQNRRADKGPAGSAGGAEVESRVVLRNLKVLAIDQNIQANKGDKAMIGTTATLEVNANDAPLVARAKSQGDIVLALRSYADAGAPSGRVAPADPTPQTVKIYRAGQRSDVTVNQ